MDKSTPRPWRVRPTHLPGGQSIEAEVPCENGLRAWFQLAVLFPREIEEEMISIEIDREANAALIVRAVNRDHAFDALVEALRGAMPALEVAVRHEERAEKASAGIAATASTKARNAIRAAHTALALAKET